MNPVYLWAGGAAVLLYLVARVQRGGGLGGLLGIDLGLGAPTIEADVLSEEAVETTVAVVETAAPLSGVIVDPLPGGTASRGWFSTRYSIELELRNGNALPREPLVEIDAEFEFLAGGVHRQRSNLGRHLVPARDANGAGLTRVRADLEVGDARAMVLPADAAPVRVILDGVQVSTTWFTVVP